MPKTLKSILFRGNRLLNSEGSLVTGPGSTLIITFAKDTSGAYRSTLASGTYGPFGTVRIGTESQVFTMQHTQHGIVLSFVSTL